MLVPLTHFQWQLLRTALRAEAAGGAPLLGRELRIIPSRLTKDGTFLDGLVAVGLLAAGKVEKAVAESKDEPVQFRTRYRLTEKGRQAAEYGEYERAHMPVSGPVKGIAALFESPAQAANGKPAGAPIRKKRRKV